MNENTDLSLDEELEDIFSKSKGYVENIVELPSKGVGYSGHSGKVQVRTMTFEDEKMLSDLSNDDNLIDILINRCTDFEDTDILYSADKIFILYKIREASFGDKVKLSSACTKCSYDNNLEVDLSKLDIEYVKEDFKDPKKVHLPDIDKDIQLTLPRSSDSEYLMNKSSILKNLWRFIKKIDKYENPRLISKAIQKLSSKDTRVILENLLMDDFGINTNAKYICEKCRSEEVVTVPITEAFFTVS